MNPALGWGCEIAPSGVSVVRWDGASREPASSRWRPLTEGALDASPLRENLLRPDEVRHALAGCLNVLGCPGSADRPVDAALVIPDQAARVFFLSFDFLPRRPAQALPLIRWKLKKSVPFDIEASTVSYVAQRTPQEWQVLAVVSPENVMRQYEELTASLGLRARFVTLSTIGSLGLVPVAHGSSGGESALLAKYSPPSLTMTIVHGGAVRLFRTVSVAPETGDDSTQCVREILEAVHPSVAYFQDNFGVPLQQAYLCGFGERSEAIAASLSEELHLPARTLLGGWAPTANDWDAVQADQFLGALMGIAQERRR